MVETWMANLASLLIVLLYIAVKDLVLPHLQRRSNQKNGWSENPGATELAAKVREFQGRSDERWAEQHRTNQRVDNNITRIFERLDEARKR